MEKFQSFEFVYNAEFVVGMFTAPNGQTHTHTQESESTQKHISKVRAEKKRKRKTRIERKTKCSTVCTTKVCMYICIFHKICRNIRNILLGTRALLWCHLNMLWNFSIEAAKCQKRQRRVLQMFFFLYFHSIKTLSVFVVYIRN